ncbi:polysaccharide deacetylase family protein [Paludicola sp. MB14-C6]|uniref:polysaccharide deacetylase family protein n=1 Tax=Paludihabitans sp. MB14-C6 TaxID=3070656 RepID=UPI0027DC16D2|nr:polysaccharide deacetylase family protein [Paludicola sp. MB14-C6]WMJ22845.1 polysaccharide deacetylase family protein [Paludicola sp. MB14-C6]
MIVAIILSIIICTFLIYSIIPTYYFKLISNNVIRKTNQPNKIMLTFDDGPDERYTNQLLDVLAENDVQATFFVVAKNAFGNHAIIKRMQDEGHEIGLHSLEHENAMFFDRRYTKEDFKQSITIMNDLNCDVTFYRPPWGHTNIFSYHYMKKYGLKMILWDVMAQDWKDNATADIIADKLMKRTKPTSIICLHDAGENSGGAKDAPLNTIAALRIAIPQLKNKGYEFITAKGLHYEKKQRKQ